MEVLQTIDERINLYVDDLSYCPNGFDLVNYICENRLRADKVYIHTDNGVGKENMFQTLKAAQRIGFIDKDIEIYHYPITQNRYSG